MRRVRAARKFLEKFDPQYPQLKEEALYATVVFFLSTLGSKSIPGRLEERQSVGETQHRWRAAELMHKVSLSRSGVI